MEKFITRKEAVNISYQAKGSEKLQMIDEKIREVASKGEREMKISFDTELSFGEIDKIIDSGFGINLI